MDDYIAKPVTLESLSAVLGGALRQPISVQSPPLLDPSTPATLRAKTNRSPHR
jgi:hypothetical protein